MGEHGRFQNKACLVTGGGSGIGRAACIRFAAEGGFVTVVDLNANNGKDTCSRITDTGGQSMFVKADVGNSRKVRSAVDAAAGKWGKLDAVVNDAAMMTFNPVIELPEEEFDHLMNVNLRSVFLFCKYAVPHMPPGGAFVNVSSVHAHQTTKNVVPYAASKGAWRRSPAALPKRLRKRSSASTV